MSAGWDPAHGGSQPPASNFKGIWDTGASGSVITENVVKACGLIQTGIKKVRGAYGGVTDAPTYLVNFFLPNQVMVMNITVTQGDFRGADVLIGMDIIVLGDFSVTNHQGITKMSYRTPSIKHIDYVNEHHVNTALQKHAGVTKTTKAKSKKKSRR